MSFEGSYNAVFMVYRIFGLVPFEFHFETTTSEVASNKRRKMCLLFVENLWFISMLLFELCSLIHVSITRYQFLVECKCIHVFIGFRLILALIFRFCVVVITVESYCHRNVQVEIIAKLLEIDQIFAQKLRLQINYHRLKRSITVVFSKWISIYIGLVSILYATSFFKGVPTEKYIRLTLFLYPFLKRTLFSSMYTTYAILIRHRIQSLNEAMDSNLLLPHDSAFKVSIDRESRNEHETFEFRRLIHLWQLFACIHDTVQLINKTFKWSISLNMFANVFIVCVSIFQYFDNAVGLPNEYYKVAPLISSNSIAFIFFYALCFGVIIQIANSVATVANQIASKVHRISSSGIISDEFENFVSKSRRHSMKKWQLKCKFAVRSCNYF